MTLKEKLAKAKLVDKYTIERNFYLKAIEKANTKYVDFYVAKAASFQAKIDELNKLEDVA